MLRLSDIEEYQDVVFLCKFIDPRHLESLLDGKLHMKTLGHFIDQERRTKKRGQGDKFEGAHVYKAENVKIIDPKTNKVIGAGKNSIFQERYNGIRDIPVFCFTKFSATDFLLLEHSKNKTKFRLSIDIKEKKRLIKDFGSKVVILPGGFLDIVKSAVKNQGYEDYMIANVKYVDHTEFDPERKKAFDNKSIEMITWKDQFFSYQREIRFALQGTSTKTPLELNIGSIKNQSIVLDTDKFLNEYLVEVLDN